MKAKVTAIIAALASGLLLIIAQAAAQTGQPPEATATRPAKTPPAQSSVPDNGPAASRTQTTGASNQDATVKSMNDKERAKVDTKGK